MLARAAADGVPEVPSLDEDRLRAYLVPWRQRFLDTGRGTAFTSSKNKVLRALCEGGQVAYDDRNQLSGCWSKLRNRIAKLVADAGPRAQRIIPQPQKHPGKHQGGEVRWSLRLPASCVRVTD